MNHCGLRTLHQYVYYVDVYYHVYIKLGGSPGGWHGNPLQYSCLENPMVRRAWQSPCGHKELDMTEQPSMAQHILSWYILSTK